jgi:hypothetical protein
MGGVRAAAPGGASARRAFAEDVSHVALMDALRTSHITRR